MKNSNPKVRFPNSNVSPSYIPTYPEPNRRAHSFGLHTEKGYQADFDHERQHVIKEDRYTTTERGYTITIWGAGDKHDGEETKRGVIYNTLGGLRVHLLEGIHGHARRSLIHTEGGYMRRWGNGEDYTRGRVVYEWKLLTH